MSLASDLKRLKSQINPNSEGFAKGRSALTNQINCIVVRNEFERGAWNGLRIGLWETWRYTFLNMRKVVALFIVVVISASGVLVAQASRAAVAGDTLYPLKRNVFEKVELVLAPSARDEAAVYLKHVAARLEEIRLINERGFSAEEKNKRLNQTVLSLNRDLTAASQSLQIAANTDTERQAAKAVTQMAKQVANSTANVKVALSTSTRATTMDGSADAKLDAAVAQALTTVSRTEQSTLDILIAKLADNPNDGETIEQVERLLRTALEAADQRVASLEQPIWTSGNIEIRLKVRQAVYALPRDAGLAKPKVSDFDSLDEDLTQVKFALSEARTHLAWHRYSRVQEQLAIARTNLDRIEDLLKGMSVLINVELVPGALDGLDDAATSTAPTISPAGATATTSAATQTNIVPK